MGRVPPGAAAAPAVFNSRQDVVSRGLGVLLRPRATMAAVVRSAAWLDVLVVSAVLAALALALVYATEVGRLALLDQWERTAIAFGRPVDDTQYARLIALSGYGPAYGVLIALLQGPVVTFAVSAVLFAALRRANRRRFVEVLAVASHAGLLLALRHLVAAPLTYVRETTASATSIGVWFPLLDEGSALARFLGLLDLFVIWWAIVLALGVAELTGRPARRLAGAFVGVYVGIATLLAGTMAVLGGVD